MAKAPPKIESNDDNILYENEFDDVLWDFYLLKKVQRKKGNVIATNPSFLAEKFSKLFCK